MGGMGITQCSTTNIVFQCAFHVVWCPKYRRRVRGGNMEARLKQIIREVLDEKGGWLVELETMPDHVHLLVEVDPQYGVHKLVKAIKGSHLAVVAGRVPLVEDADSYAVDQRLRRGHRGRCAAVGHQTLRRAAEDAVKRC